MQVNLDFTQPVIAFPTINRVLLWIRYSSITTLYKSKMEMKKAVAVVVIDLTTTTTASKEDSSVIERCDDTDDPNQQRPATNSSSCDNEIIELLSDDDDDSDHTGSSSCVPVGRERSISSGTTRKDRNKVVGISNVAGLSRLVSTATSIQHAATTHEQQRPKNSARRNPYNVKKKDTTNTAAARHTNNNTATTESRKKRQRNENSSATTTTTADTGVRTESVLQEICTVCSYLNNSQQSKKKSKFVTIDDKNDSTQQIVSATQHIQQKDKWSCGFRNLQMILSSFLPILPKQHSYYYCCYTAKKQQHQSTTAADDDSRRIELPSIQQIKDGFEQLWEQGYDSVGKRQYNGTMNGRALWLGAVDVCYWYTFHGIDATVVQFISCTQSRQVLPKFLYSYYFNTNAITSTSNSTSTSSLQIAKQCLQTAESTSTTTTTNLSYVKLPLYLQWKGHSVTIVGIEILYTNTDAVDVVKNVIVLDPSKNGSRIKTSLQAILQKKKTAQQSLPTTCVIPVSKLITKDCQLVVSSIQSLSISDMESIRRHGANVVTAARHAVVAATTK